VGDKRKQPLIEDSLYEKKFTIQRFIAFIQLGSLASQHVAKQIVHPVEI
jgi:hypothetical protein